MGRTSFRGAGSAPSAVAADLRGALAPPGGRFGGDGGLGSGFLSSLEDPSLAGPVLGPSSWDGAKPSWKPPGIHV